MIAAHDRKWRPDRAISTRLPAARALVLAVKLNDTIG
jgi:hypothetical protein